MDISNAQRQVAEINALKGHPKYAHVLQIATPALFNRLEVVVACSSSSSNQQQSVPVKKCVAIKIVCNEIDDVRDELSSLEVDITLPLSYPTASVICQDDIQATNKGEAAEALSKKLSTYLEQFTGCECIELIIDWLIDNKSTCLSASNVVHSASNNDSSNASRVECYILRYNHLLSGPEHKKEKAMVNTAKKGKLQGGLLWGTPGIVVVVPPSTIEDAKEYATDCRDIGKRPDGVESFYLQKDALEEVGLGGLAQQKRGGKLKDMDTATLRAACGGDEELLRNVLGVK